MVDVTMTTCKNCLQVLERYRAGRYPNGKDTRYTNKEGKEWSGRLCPQCHVNKVAESKKRKKSEQ